MSLNCNEINLILSELNLEGAFIQEIVQPGYDTIAFYTYKEGNPKTVLVCTAQNSVRLNETRKKITKNDKPLRFMEFLRSHIKGCRINSCAQIGLERVVLMDLSRIVTVEDRNRDSTNHIRLASTSINTSKTAYSMTSQPQNEEVTENYKLYLKLWNNAANIIICDENNLILDVMFRRPDRYEIKDETFIPPAVNEEKIAEGKDRFPVREWQQDEHDSFNTFIDFWYSEHAQNLSREALLEKAEKWYNTNHSKKEAALNKLLQKQSDFQNAEQLKHYGDLIMSFGYGMTGESRFLECEDYETGKTVRILIDPKKSVQENAGEYYKNYKKAVSGADELNRDIEIAKKQLEKLDAEYAAIKNEKNPVKIEQMLRRDQTPVQKQKKTHPGLEYVINGWLLYVGRDANENDDLLRHHVRGDDLWLHVRDFPGGYVFVKAQKNKTVPLEILLDAGNLAVYYSKARTNTKVDLYYTHVKYLRRAKNGPKGLVIPTQEKNLCITPDKARLSRLDSLHEEAQL